jgi:protein tyrosine/serine phosphatase
MSCVNRADSELAPSSEVLRGGSLNNRQSSDTGFHSVRGTQRIRSNSSSSADEVTKRVCLKALEVPEVFPYNVECSD